MTSSAAPRVAAAPVAPSPLLVSAPIDRVTVYAAGALVTRRARVPWPGGATGAAVEVRGLPLALDDASVRVEVAGGAEAVDVRLGLDRARAEAPARPPSQEALREASARLRAAEARLARVRGERAQVASTEVPVGQGVRARPDAPAATEPARAAATVAGWVDGLLARLDAELAELGREVRERRREQARLEEELSRAAASARADAARIEKRCVVELRAPAGLAGEVTVELEYAVPGATWAPAYDVRVSPDRTVELALHAVVAQRSGEDWQGVRLSISTADLLRSMDAPELRSLRIGRAQSPPRPAFRPPAAGLDELFADHDQAVRHLLAGPAAPPEPEEPDEELPLGLPSPSQSEPPPPPRPPSSTGRTAPLARPAAPPPAPAPPSAPKLAMPMAAPAPAPGPPLGGPAQGSAPPPGAPVAARKRKAVREELAREEAAPTRAGGGSLEQALAGLPDGFAGDEPPEEPFAPPASEVSLEIAAAFVLYARLELAGPDGPRRGRLVPPASPYEGLPPETAAQLAAAEARARNVAALPARSRSPRASAGTFDYRYDADGRVDVPSDAEVHVVPVLRARGAGTLRALLVPRVEPRAFREVTFPNPLGAPLLAGPASVFYDDAFVAETDVESVPPGGELRIGLGVEEGIKIARNTRFHETQAGLLGGSVELEHDVELELASRLRLPASLEIHERVPALREKEKEIEVTVEEAEPRWEPWPDGYRGRDVPGGRIWRIELGPGEERRLVARYVVRISSKLELEGGNRRE